MGDCPQNWLSKELAACVAQAASFSVHTSSKEEKRLCQMFWS